MAANLEPVAARPHVVGVVDHPRREPQHFALERLERLELGGADRRHRRELGRAALAR